MQRLKFTFLLCLLAGGVVLTLPLAQPAVRAESEGEGPLIIGTVLDRQINLASWIATAVFIGMLVLVIVSANMVASGIAERAGYVISYAYFFKKGFPALLLTVGLATVWLLFRLL